MLENTTAMNSLQFLMNGILNSKGYIMNNFILQTMVIVPYWLGGIVLGAFLKTWHRDNVDKMFFRLSSSKSTLLMLVISSALGALSPITLFGVIPVIFSINIKKNKKFEPLIIAFITSSILISPNIFVFTISLGIDIALLRILSVVAIGLIMGLISDIMISLNKSFLILSEDEKQKAGNLSGKNDKKTMIFLKNFYYAFKKTGINLFIGILVSFALYAFVPQTFYDATFTSNTVAVPVSAVLSTFLYQCGGASIPIIQGLLREGLSAGAAITFMLAGPLTKMTNLAALKSIMTLKRLLLYCGILFIYALSIGWLIG